MSSVTTTTNAFGLSTLTRCLALFVTFTAMLSTVVNVLLYKYQRSPFSSTTLHCRDWSIALANQKRPLDKSRGTADVIVDAVITYVNGDEPNFISQLEKFRNESRLKYSFTKNRFEDHGNLRMLLRSLDAYGKMFRHIFLVVSSPTQLPVWLNKSYDRLKVVYHKDIWRDKSQLPVFNSLAIEANLHHIDGLSDSFVYFNDDLILVNEVLPEDFFWELRRPINKRLAILFRANLDELPKNVSKNSPTFHYIGPALRTSDVTRDLCFNEGPYQKQVQQHRRLAFGMLPKHTPHLLMRSVLKKAEKDAHFSALFKATSGSRFRSGKELNAVMLFYAYAECKLNMSVLLGPNDSGYVPINQGTKGNAKQRYQKSLGYYARGIKKGWKKSICFNDVTDLRKVTVNGTEAAKAAYEWRASYFPEKSSFEL